MYIAQLQHQMYPADDSVKVHCKEFGEQEATNPFDQCGDKGDNVLVDVVMPRLVIIQVRQHFETTG